MKFVSARISESEDALWLLQDYSDKPINPIFNLTGLPEEKEGEREKEREREKKKEREKERERVRKREIER